MVVKAQSERKFTIMHSIRGGVTRWMCSLLLACACLVSNAQEAPRIKAVDVYGTDALDANAIRHELRNELDLLAAAIAAQDVKHIADLKTAITTRVRALGDFAYLELSIIQYPPPTSALYATIDAVEAKDRAVRMPFRAAPTRKHPDPDSLIAAWDEYSSELSALVRRGEITGHGDCPVLHCLVPFTHQALQPYLTRFNAGAAAHKNLLLDIVLSEGDAHRRATAIFLLAHANDASALMPVLGQAMYDADREVRNNAMRVMVDMAVKGLHVEYPMKDILAALDFLATTDRNKAVAVTATVIEKMPEYREVVLQHGVPALLRLLKLDQPNNHEFAYQALKILSGRDYGPRAYDRWAAWAAEIGSKQSVGVPPS